MLEITFAIQYYLFMKWLKHAHPGLYSRYGLHIQVPDERHKKIRITRDCVDLRDRSQLQNAVDEYYTTLTN